MFCSSSFGFYIETDYNIEAKPEIAPVFGVFLPFGVVGVRDSYPMIGLYYSNKAFTAPKYEIGLFSANAKGVSFYTGSLGYKIDAKLYETLEGFLNFGIDAHYYKRKAGTFTEYDFVSTGGAHVGFGIYHQLGPNLYIRWDVKMNFGPGKTAFVGLSIAKRFEASSEEENP